MSDGSMTFGEAALRVEEFCKAREWDQFHNPKDLAIGILTEASELLSLFRFKSDSESLRSLDDQVFRSKIGEELADVQYFLLRFSRLYGFDLSNELEHKLKLNEARYPVGKAKGSSKKYDEL